MFISVNIYQQNHIILTFQIINSTWAKKGKGVTQFNNFKEVETMPIPYFYFLHAF